ncbi:hypothetical protein C8R46DRAFT_1217102 [Mycena filopes]|nr:hypothetical protein C8R46DRAFT_1217102 [Mycena filopes]
MRAFALGPLLLVATAHAASVSRRQGMGCPTADKAGTSLTTSQGKGNSIVCNYAGAGACEYGLLDGCLSSGSSDCPASAAQGVSDVTCRPLSSFLPGVSASGSIARSSPSASAPSPSPSKDTNEGSAVGVWAPGLLVLVALGIAVLG